MSNLGESVIVVEGPNAKVVYDFLNEMQRDESFKYKIRPLTVNGVECESNILWCRYNEKLAILLVCDTSHGYFDSYDVKYEYVNGRLFIICNYVNVNAIAYLIENLISEGWYCAQWSEADCFAGNLLIDDERKYFGHILTDHFGDGTEVEVINVVDEELQGWMKNIRGAGNK